VALAFQRARLGELLETAPTVDAALN